MSILGDFGPAAKAPVTTLRAVTSDPRYNSLREAAARALQ
jgi:hypothetical protein